MFFMTLHKIRRSVCNWGLFGLLLLPAGLSQAAVPDTRDTGLYSALSLGTAWAITDQHVVTNYHVIADTHNIRLVSPDQSEIPVTLVASDPRNDLAILAITGKTRLDSPLPIARGESRLGSQVFTIGYPHPDLMGTHPKLTTGHINALTGIADDPRIYQVSVPVQSGNSGGPLLNMQGEVIAIITSKLNAKKVFDRTGDVPQNVNYAVKVSHLTSLLNKLAINTQPDNNNKHGKQSLEALADKTLNSVLIIAGDTLNRKKKTNTVIHSGAPPQAKDQPPSKREHIIIYTYAEPGAYDRRENITGSATVKNYSINTSKVLKKQVLETLDNTARIDIEAGQRTKKIYYTLDNPAVRYSLCSGGKANKIITSFSDSNPGFHFRYITYRIIDCLNRRDYTKQYTIQRDERYDSFGYEIDIHNTFKDFLQKIPPFITLSQNQ